MLRAFVGCINDDGSVPACRIDGSSMEQRIAPLHLLRPSVCFEHIAFHKMQSFRNTKRFCVFFHVIDLFRVG